MVLPRGLKRGAWIELDDADIRALVNAAGGMGAKAQPNRRERGDVEQGLNGAPPGNRGRNQRRGGRNGGPRPSGNGQRPGPSPFPRNDGGANGPRSGSKAGPRSEARRDGQAGAGQPDPMKTSFGYIGADSFSRQRQDGGQRPRGGQNGPRRGGRGRP
jgi:23S rRNA pseudouridine2605 synthase